jgi:hypothetical protein
MIVFVDVERLFVQSNAAYSNILRVVVIKLVGLNRVLTASPTKTVGLSD